MTRTIIAVDRDEDDAYVTTGEFEILSDDPDFDLIQAMREASDEYLKTRDGIRDLRRTCGYWNFGDFMANMPEEICRRNGFKIMDEGVADFTIDFNEELYTDEPDETEAFAEYMASNETTEEEKKEFLGKKPSADPSILKEQVNDRIDMMDEDELDQMIEEWLDVDED